ncbi:MAG TPA: helix-hairpin-helix domain-containing protein [Syntrophomonadaceae bacterium]|nr:helix-hairpin-helix domain-containing protein [Syntrophomonadaceae bacterium]HPR92563.1 helix-hairpin-helix domain-containing protein [Syntrophomonadaceae bacterium]
MHFDKRILAGFVIILILVFAAGVKYAEIKHDRSAAAEDLQLSITQEEDVAEQTTPEEEETEIKAYITGAVKNPGVYSFSAGARIYEALEMACPLENAELKYVEMARVIEDEETIYIPAQGETEVPQDYQFLSASAVDKSGKVNINKATAEELSSNLNGIGPTLAQRIIDYRESNGAFKNIEEIKNVSGIGDKRYADIKEMIVVK